MNKRTPAWGQGKHERTLVSALTYWLSSVAYHVAPNKMTRLLHEKGFSVKPFGLSGEQRELRQQAHSYHLAFNNSKIQVFEWGTGPLVLLVHGWEGRALQLDALIRALLEKGYKVAAFDQKGHGESSTRFSSYPEIARSTALVMAHYGGKLYGVVAHSIGANALFKASENIERQLRIAVIAPVENFIGVLENMRTRLGIYEKLFAQAIRKIEAESGLLLAELNELDYEKIGRHDVLLVHDKFDRVNNVSASHEIHRNLHGSSLMQTEMLGHSRILANRAVVDRVVAHFASPK